MYDPTQGTIRLDVEVKDKSGYPGTGLGQQDFTLQDNGRPGTIVTFHAFDAVRARPDPPVEVILVIDELNMQEEMQLQAAQDEAEALLRRNQGHLAQPVSIYRIRRDGAWTGSHSSSDGNALAEEIAHQSAPHVSWKQANVSVHASPLMNGKPINLNVTVSLESSVPSPSKSAAGRAGNCCFGSALAGKSIGPSKASYAKPSAALFSGSAFGNSKINMAPALSQATGRHASADLRPQLFRRESRRDPPPAHLA
jgi:hypothetical protein